MAEELIRMENISKFYGRVQALERVTLKVYENEIVGILDARGPSCADSSHEPGQNLPLDAIDDTPRLSAQSSDRNQGKRI